MITAVSFGRSPETIQRRQKTKDGLQKAEILLRQTQNKYGRPNSSTYIQLKLNQHKDDDRYKEISRKLRENAETYSEDLMYRPYNNITTAMNGRVAGKKYVGDCGECAQVIQNEFLFNHRQPTVNIVMTVNKADKKGFCNHAFNLSNIEKGAKATNPKTWGKQAIITDLWSGIAMKAEDAIPYYYDLFSVNPNEDNIKFDVMPDSDFSLQHECLKYFDMLPPRMDIPYQSLWE